MTDERFVVVKFISGETVMAMFEGEDERYVRLEKPIKIRTVDIPGINRESLTASPFCQFSESSSFVMEKEHILYIKKLHRLYIPHYKNFIKAYEEALIPVEKTREAMDALEQDWDDEPTTVEEVQRRVEALQALLDSEEEIDERMFMEGNETKH